MDMGKYLNISIGEKERGTRAALHAGKAKPMDLDKKKDAER